MLGARFTLKRAFSPKLDTAPGGLEVTVRCSHSPERHVGGTAGGVTTEGLAHRAVLPGGGANTSPEAPPPAPPTAARAVTTPIFLHRHAPSFAPVGCILDVGEFGRVESPHVGGATPGATPTRSPLENEIMAAASHWWERTLVLEIDGRGRGSQQLGSAIRAGRR